MVIIYSAVFLIINLTVISCSCVFNIDQRYITMHCNNIVISCNILVIIDMYCTHHERSNATEQIQ